MVVYIEETLKSGDLPADLIPHLVYGEVLTGARRPLVFIQAVKEDVSLVGSHGTKVSVPKLTQLTSSDVSSDTESNIDTSGYSETTEAITDTDVSIGNEIYIAVKLSKTLLEDQPDIDWLRLTLQNMGSAMQEYLDDAIMDTLISGAGSTQSVDGGVAYADLVDTMAYLKNASWFPDADGFYLFANPDQAATLAKETTYTDTVRFTTAEVARMVEGETGRIASFRILESPNMTKKLMLAVTPPTHRFGPSTILAWKRNMDVAVHDQANYARKMYITSMRYGVAVVQSGGIRLLSNC